ncbi:cation diffusion facilitator family transporter [Anaeromassilibacillus senegalensis]|uniref:cation diffusion facilitator family transporter n=1 Tax=Anaeromassilibacillus senegalensis TaxID=1673717 RepID=UPI000681D252|nr:cation diffusion facilitator family transporter [Anaeromassilibacillus senegalensis]
MTNLLVRLFIKDYQNVKDSRVREQYGKFAGVVGIVTNLLLSVIKALAGFLFHSVAILADAVNNLSDSASSIVTLVGFKLSAKPADKEHPYGHARIEYISGLIVSLVILLLGFQLVQSSIGKILQPEETEISLLAVAVLVVSMLIKLWQFFFYRKLGRRIASTTLEATAADSRNDVISTGAILIGMGITRLTGYNLDGWMGLVVAILVIVGGVKLIMETSDPLLGIAPSKELVDGVYQKILSYKGVLGLHDLSVHNYGPGRCFASVHCEVPAEQDVMVSHDIIDNIERDFLQDMNIHLVIHMDPVVTDDERTNTLKQQVVQKLRTLSTEIDMHDFRVVWGNTHTNLIFDVCVPFGFQWSDSELLQRVEETIKELDSHYFTVVTVDHDYVPHFVEK